MRRLHGVTEFLTVVEEGSFSAAADTLGVSTSFISRRVADLEAYLGVRLLHRTTRRVSLTELGRYYQERAAHILGGLETLESDLADQQNLNVGLLRITAAGTYAETQVGPALAKFAALHPRVRVDFEITDRVVDLVGEGFDLAIRHGAVHDESLVARRLSTRRVRVFAAPAYLAHYGCPRHPSELSQHICLPFRNYPWRFLIDGQRVERIIQGPWSSNIGPGLVAGAVEGLGLIQIAETYVAEAVASGCLEPVLSDFEPEPQVTWLVYPSRHKLPNRVRSLIDFLLEQLGPPKNQAASSQV